MQWLKDNWKGLATTAVVIIVVGTALKFGKKYLPAKAQSILPF